jgi:hypothetical protein
MWSTFVKIKRLSPALKHSSFRNWTSYLPRLYFISVLLLPFILVAAVPLTAILGLPTLPLSFTFGVLILALRRYPDPKPKSKGGQ